MLGLELVVAGHLLWHASAEKPPAIACPVQKAARVDIRWHSEPIKYDYNTSIADLNHTDIDTVSPYGTHVATDVGGLMSGKVEYTSNLQVSMVKYPAGNVTCLWVDQILIDVTIDPLIKIAKEHPEGSCERKSILEHEYKHVAVDRAVVKDHLERARAATAEAVQRVGMVGPKPDALSETYKKKIIDYVQGALKDEMDKMYEDRRARQAAVDSKEEYDRVDALCPKSNSKSGTTRP